MTISIISTSKDLDIYNKTVTFFKSKGIAVKLCGPYNKEHKISFNLPITNSSNKFLPATSPLYTYKSDLVDFLIDVNEMSGSKDMEYSPYIGLIIYTGDGSKEIKNFVSKTDFEATQNLKNRLFFIDSDDLLNENLEGILDKSMIVWTKYENSKI